MEVFITNHDGHHGSVTKSGGDGRSSGVECRVVRQAGTHRKRHIRRASGRCWTSLSGAAASTRQT